MSRREPDGRPQRGRPLRQRGRGRDAPTHARLLALRLLERIDRTHAYADRVLAHALSRCALSTSDRALVTELVYGTLRWRGRLDFLLGQVLDRDLGKLEAMVTTALRLGAYQILFTDRIRDSAAVDQTVRCVRAAGLDRATGLVNAVLRRLAAEHERLALPGLADDPLGHLCHALSYPRWLAESWVERFGPAEAAALAESMNRVPPRSVRVNRLRASRDAVLAEIRERFPEAALSPLAPDGLRLGPRGQPSQDPAFLDGRLTVQDEASQLVVELLDPQPDERVLDLCAAPGTKSTAIAERVGPGGRVLALDRHARRLGLVSRDARRLGLPWIETQERDATLPLDDLAGDGPFDRVLVDAPCTGIGSLRRNPDARWRVKAGDARRLAETQRALLARAASVLRPGGTLVYSTCSFEPAENEAVVRAVLEDSDRLRPCAPEVASAAVRPRIDADGYLRLWPHRDDTDGFTAIRLEQAP